MTIGKHCQLCGAKKKPSHVIAEAHGIVVTAPCLMTRVYGDPPTPAEQVRAMAKYCAVCGAENEQPLSGHCKNCNSALTAEDGLKDLVQTGTKPEFNARIIAFLIDLVIVAAISCAVVLAIGAIEQSYNASAKIVAGEGEGMNFFTFLKLLSVAAIFVLYHGIFTTLGGRTVGKMLLGIRVVLKNGNKDIDFLRALVRSALYLFTLYVIPIGLLPLLFQEPPGRWLELIEADALYHDTLTDTVVIKPDYRQT